MRVRCLLTVLLTTVAFIPAAHAEPSLEQIALRAAQRAALDPFDDNEATMCLALAAAGSPCQEEQVITGSGPIGRCAYTWRLRKRNVFPRYFINLRVHVSFGCVEAISFCEAQAFVTSGVPHAIAGFSTADEGGINCTLDTSPSLFGVRGVPGVWHGLVVFRRATGAADTTPPVLFTP